MWPTKENQVAFFIKKKIGTQIRVEEDSTYVVGCMTTPPTQPVKKIDDGSKEVRMHTLKTW
jgi:hypothetical protein